jgi:hypothetical protein
MYVVKIERIVRASGQFKITDILVVIFAVVVFMITNCYLCNAINRICIGGFKYVRP